MPLKDEEITEKIGGRPHYYSTIGSEKSDFWGTAGKVHRLAGAISYLAGADKLTDKISGSLHKSGLGSFSALLPRLIPRQAEIPLSGGTSLSIGQLPARELEGRPRGLMFKTPWDFFSGKRSKKGFGVGD